MIVVAIVGVLTAVGLPELTKAQNRAKDSAAKATLTNAAKECSLSLISVGDASEYTGGTADTPFADVAGTCAIPATGNLTLGIVSAAAVDGEGFKIELPGQGSTPGVVEEATKAELAAL